MNKACVFVSFILGGAVGSLVTWKFVEVKYARIAKEEIDSVKDVFSSRDPETAEANKDILDSDVYELARKAANKPSINEYARMLSDEGYTDYTDLETMTVEEVRERFGYDKPREDTSEDYEFKEKPYVISPDEFGELECEGYEEISLVYYADHVLTEDTGEIVEDVEDTVGFDSLTHFGEYEDDSVFVRNDRLKCDYEILLDTRKYSEAIKIKRPSMRET